MLVVSDEAELLRIGEALSLREIRHVAYRDPDPPFCGSVSVIGVEPQPRSSALKRVLGHLPKLEPKPGE